MKTTTVRQHTRRKPQRPADPFADMIAAGIEKRKREASARKAAKTLMLMASDADRAKPKPSEVQLAFDKAATAFRNFVETIRKGK